MTTFRVNKNANYSVINNQFLNDEKLSWKAKGILTWLLSRPDNWQIFLKDMQERSKDGRDSTATGINELIEIGYIVREQLKNDKNHFTGYNYQVFELANSESGKPEIGDVETGKADTNKYSPNQILKQSNTKQNIAFNFDGFIESEIESINLWFKHLKSKRKTYTTQDQADLAREEMLEFKKIQDLTSLIKLCITKGWKGLYLPNQQKPKHSAPSVHKCNSIDYENNGGFY